MIPTPSWRRPDMAGLSFIPWLRARSRTGLPAAGQADTDRTLAITVATNVPPVTVPVPIVGPGDIIGLDARVVVRVLPGRDESDAEFDQFPRSSWIPSICLALLANGGGASSRPGSRSLAALARPRRAEGRRDRPARSRTRRSEARAVDGEPVVPAGPHSLLGLGARTGGRDRHAGDGAVGARRRARPPRRPHRLSARARAAHRLQRLRRALFSARFDRGRRANPGVDARSAGRLGRERQR